jgi:hypothetical protein
MFDISRFKQGTVAEATITNEGEWLSGPTLRATGRLISGGPQFNKVQVRFLRDLQLAMSDDSTLVFDFEDDRCSAYTVTSHRQLDGRYEYTVTCQSADSVGRRSTYCSQDEAIKDAFNAFLSN